MPVFSLCSQRLSREALNHRLPRNLKLQNEPSPISGQFTVVRTPSSGWAQAHLARPNEPRKLLKTMDRTCEGVSVFGRTTIAFSASSAPPW